MLIACASEGLESPAKSGVFQPIRLRQLFDEDEMVSCQIWMSLHGISRPELYFHHRNFLTIFEIER